MKTVASSLLSGFIFGLGLAVSQMIDPARVIGFLDVAGRWDATLLFVMGGALAVTVPGFPVILSRPHPLLAPKFSLPAKTEIDRPLIIGAAIFGVVGAWPDSVRVPRSPLWPRSRRPWFCLWRR